MNPPDWKDLGHDNHEWTAQTAHYVIEGCEDGWVALLLEPGDDFPKPLATGGCAYSTLESAQEACEESESIRLGETEVLPHAGHTTLDPRGRGLR